MSIEKEIQWIAGICERLGGAEALVAQAGWCNIHSACQQQGQECFIALTEHLDADFHTTLADALERQP